MITPEKINVLVVEDDVMVLEMIKRNLIKAGYNIISEAYDGEEAIEKVQSLHPDVILMDIQMPQMDGLEATEIIQKQCPTPVVMMTAFEAPQMVDQAGKAGVGAYLVKPARPSEIDRAIAIAMARFADMEELRRLNQNLKTRNTELAKALDEIKILSGLLPMCASCKNIRDDDGFWVQVETYFSTHSDLEFSHGICPDCMQKMYPELSQKMNERRQDILTHLQRMKWATLTQIAEDIDQPESNTHNRLKNMVEMGQVEQIFVDGETYYGVSSGTG